MSSEPDERRGKGARTEIAGDERNSRGDCGARASPILAGLRDVPRSGTGRGLESAWRRAGLPATLFAKTGTLTEPGQPGPDDDLYVKSLLFAVGEESPGEVRSLECGLVGGIYLRFAEGPRRGSMPSYQLEFARERLGDFLQTHWESFGVCEP